MFIVDMSGGLILFLCTAKQYGPSCTWLYISSCILAVESTQIAKPSSSYPVIREAATEKNSVFYWSSPPPQSLVSTYFRGIFFRVGPLKNSFFAASLINIEYRQGGWGRASPSSSNVLIYLDTFEI